MSELRQIYALHKKLGFKDKDIKKMFERKCTPSNVIELLDDIERMEKRLAEVNK